MIEHNNEMPILSRNPETGYYEGTLRIQVDAEIFRNMMLQAVKEDEAGDLTKPETWQRAINRVGSVAYWLNRPHAKMTPIAGIPQEAPEKQHSPNWGGVRPGSGRPPQSDQKEELMPPSGVEEVKLALSPQEELEEATWEKAKHIPPYLWEERLLPPLSDDMSRDEKQPIYRKRHVIRQILLKLLEEYKRGNFVLDAEAEQQERLHQESIEEKLNIKLETVQVAVNGHRLG